MAGYILPLVLLCLYSYASGLHSHQMVTFIEDLVQLKQYSTFLILKDNAASLLEELRRAVLARTMYRNFIGFNVNTPDVWCLNRSIPVSKNHLNIYFYTEIHHPDQEFIVQFGPDEQWLILTSVTHKQKLLTLLNSTGLRIDSNVVIGLADPENNILIMEVYKTGNKGPLSTIPLGNWGTNLSEVDKFELLTSSFKYKRRGNLYGYKLKAVTVLVNSFYIQINNSGGNYKITGGYFGSIFTNLMEMMNFTYELQYLPGYSYGNVDKDGKNWTGIIGVLQRNEADLSACEVSISSNRMDIIGFSTPIHSVSRQLFAHVGAKMMASDYYIQPYSLHAWLAMALVVVSLIVIRKFLGYLSHRYLNLETPRSECADFFTIISITLQQGTDVPRSYPLRLLQLSGAVFFLLAYTAYSAKLTATSTLNQNDLAIRGLKDIFTSSYWKLTLIRDSFSKKIFEEAQPATLEGQLWELKLFNNPSQFVDSTVEGLHKVLFSPQNIFLGQEDSCLQALTMNFTPEEACQIGAVLERYYTSGLGFGLQWQSQYKEIIDYNLLKLKETGLMQRLAHKWIPHEIQCSGNTHESAELRDVLPLIIILMTGIGLAIIVFLLELWTSKICMQQNTRHLFSSDGATSTAVSALTTTLVISMLFGFLHENLSFDPG